MRVINKILPTSNIRCVFSLQMYVYYSRPHKNMSHKREPKFDNVFKIEIERDLIFIYFLCKLCIENTIRFNKIQ